MSMLDDRDLVLLRLLQQPVLGRSVLEIVLAAMTIFELFSSEMTSLVPMVYLPLFMASFRTAPAPAGLSLPEILLCDHSIDSV